MAGLPIAPHERTQPAKSVGQHRRRPPPKLRTKTGCLTCRTRRKKCDERRPICVACTRNHISCNWGLRGTGEEVELAPGESLSAVARCTAQHSARQKRNISGVPPGLSQSIFPKDHIVLSQNIIHSSTPTYAQVAETSRKSSFSTEEETPSDSFEGNFALMLPGQHLAALNLAAYGLKSSQEADLLQHMSQNLFPTLISSHAHPGFWKQGTWLSTSSEPRPLVDALLALSSLYLSNKSTYYDERAVGYYSKSMHDLRKQVASQSMSGSEDHLLMNVVWLYIYEIWAMRLDRRIGAAAHLKGALQILKLRQDSNLATQNGTIKAVDRLIAESCLYHLANMAFFDPSLSSPRIAEVRKILEPLLSRSPFPNCSSLANCPVLVVPGEMYFLVLEVSQLSHRTPLSSKDQVRALQLTIALGNLKTQEDASPFDPLDSDTRMMYDAAYLYVLAAKTLLFQLLNPHTSHTHSAIQKYVSFAISILRTGVMGQPCKQFFCWPLLILSSVLEYSDDIAFVHHELQAAWEISSCGNVLVVLQVFEAITRRRMAGEEVDTLEFLKNLQGDMSASMIDGIDDRVFEMV